MKLNPLFRIGLIGAGIFFATARELPLHAAVYTSGHGDIGIEYTPGETEFEPHWHLDAGAIVDGAPLPFGGEEYEPDAVIARLGTRTTASGGIATALGVDSGTAVWRTGSSAYPPNLGFALEEVGMPEDWLDEVITLTLTSVSGPGAVAVSQTIISVGTFVWFSSDIGATVMDNQWDFGVGGHQHLDWYFTLPGMYEFEFSWSGVYIGGETPINVSGEGVFGVQVVPEPGTWALLGGGVIVMGFLRRRLRRGTA